MKKVSIIVPIYNSEKHLEKCINSIIKQTYKNIEIILINDGSTDNSLEKIKELSLKYQNIKYYTQTNKGVARTRNSGIRYAKGSYIMFVDNDDYIEKDYVETFVNEIEKENYDYVIGGYKRVDENGKTLLKQTYQNKPWSYFIFVTPWAKIFNKDFLIKHNIKFLPVKIGEDIYFNVCALSWSKNKNVINYNGYNWVNNLTSISNTVHKQNTENNKDELIYLFNSIIKNANQKDIKENKNLYKYFFLKTSIWYILYSGKNDNYKNNYYTYLKLKEWIKENFDKPYKKMFNFKPDGERLKVKMIIKTFIFLDNIGLLKTFLRIYSK